MVGRPVKLLAQTWTFLPSYKLAASRSRIAAYMIDVNLLHVLARHTVSLTRERCASPRLMLDSVVVTRWLEQSTSNHDKSINQLGLVMNKNIFYSWLSEK